MLEGAPRRVDSPVGGADGAGGGEAGVEGAAGCTLRLVRQFLPQAFLSPPASYCVARGVLLAGPLVRPQDFRAGET